MGFWGTVLLARTSGLSLLDLDPVVARSEGLEHEDVRGAWRAGVFPGGDLESAAPELHLELVEATGAPVMTAFILDSDCAVIEAAGPSTGFWRSCLAREAMQAYEEDDADGVAFDERYLPPEAAAGAAAAWAREAGFDVDHEELRRLFETEPDLLVDGLVDRLAVALGVPPVEADDDRAEDPVGPTAPARARAARPGNPVDRLVREVADPLLRPIGFSRRGREFIRTTAGGDVIEILVDAKGISSPEDFSFETSVALTPRAHLAWQEAGLARAYLARPVRMELPALGEPPREHSYRGHAPWVVSPYTRLSWGAAAVAWERSLREYLLPAVARLEDSRFVMDLLGDPRRRPLVDWSRNQVLTAFGVGPCWQLDLTLSHLEQAQAGDHQLMSWGTRWAQERHGASDGWRQEQRSGPLAALFEEVVRALAPTLQAHGLARQGTTSTFTRSNGYGDRLLVTVGPAFSATAEQPVIMVEFSVLPALEWEWQQQPDVRRRVTAEPVARDGWSYRRVSPPPDLTLDSTPFSDLDLWRIAATDGSPSAEDVAALIESVAAQLPAAERLLDRDQLTDLLFPADRRIGRELRIGAPSDLHCRILLRAGSSRTEDVIGLIDEALSDTNLVPYESSFLTWVRSRLTS